MNDSKDTSAFWDRVAQRYARMTLRNPAAYEQTLNLVKAHLRPDFNVLELGCGTGTTALRLAPFVAQYDASDYSAAMIAIAAEKKTAEAADNLTLHVARSGDGSLPRGPFDMVVGFNILHLLPDRSVAFAEVHDLLRPGGLFMSKTPCLGGAYRLAAPLVALLRLFGKAPQFTFLSPDALERDITNAGFTIRARGAHPEGSVRHYIVAEKAP